MLAVEVEQGAVGMGAVGAHASAGTHAAQVHDLSLWQVEELPSGLADPEAVIHVLKVHEEAFIEQTSLFQHYPAQHEAGAGNVSDFNRCVTCRIGLQVSANSFSHEQARSAGKDLSCAVAGDEARNAQQSPDQQYGPRAVADAGLDAAIGIQQLAGGGPGSAFAVKKLRHHVQRAGIHYGVTIQEQDVLARSHAYPLVIGPGKTCVLLVAY